MNKKSTNTFLIFFRIVYKKYYMTGLVFELEGAGDGEFLIF